MDNNNNITLNIDTDKSQIFDLEFKRNGFYDDKERTSFIKKVERIIRTSPEYKDWVRYIKEVKGYDYCQFTHEVSNEVTIEIHHHPFTLFDLVTIILDTYEHRQQLFTSYLIAEEVMKLHYQDFVGYVPLVKTLHEKYHNGFLHIPIDLVHGNWSYIISNVGSIFYVSDEILEKIQSLSSIKLNDNNNNDLVEKYQNWYNNVIG